MAKKGTKKSISLTLRNYFITGVVVLIPIGFTLYLSKILISISSNLIPKNLNPNHYLPFDIPGIEILISILSIDENGNPIYGGMPKWGIFQLSSLVKINSKTYLQVLLDNIFDIHYREFASGISSPGRSLNLKLTLN